MIEEYRKDLVYNKKIIKYIHLLYIDFFLDNRIYNYYKINEDDELLNIYSTLQYYFFEFLKKQSFLNFKYVEYFFVNFHHHVKMHINRNQYITNIMKRFMKLEKYMKTKLNENATSP